MIKRILAAIAAGLMLAAGVSAASAADAHAKTMTVGGSAHAKFGNSL